MLLFLSSFVLHLSILEYFVEFNFNDARSNFIDEKFYQIEVSRKNSGFYSHSFKLHDSVCYCLDNNLSRVNIAEYMLTHIEEFSFLNSRVYSCVMYNATNSLMKIINDPVGAIPIYYALNNQNNEFIVTSDYLMILKLDQGFGGGVYSHPTTAVPGTITSIDVTTLQVVDLYHYNPSLYGNAAFDASPPLRESYRLYAAALNSVAIAARGVRSENDKIMIELDSLEANSMLLKCAADSYMMHMSRRDPKVFTYTTTALVHHNYKIDERVIALVNDFTNPRGVDASYSPLFGDNVHIHGPTFTKIVRERWEICQLATENNITAIWMYDSGIVSTTDTYFYLRPLKVMLQTLFCSHLGVKLIYPFADGEFQRLIWSGESMKSFDYLHNKVFRSLDILHSEKICPTLPNEVTGDHGSAFHGPKRFEFPPPVLSLDVEASLDKPIGFENGRIKMSQYSAYKKHKPSHRLGSLWRIVTSTTTASRTAADITVIVLLATSGYRDMLYNFLYHAQVVAERSTALNGFKMADFLVVTSDHDIVELVQMFGGKYYFVDERKIVFADVKDRKAVRPRSRETIEYNQGEKSNSTLCTAEFGSLHYQELMLYRTNIVMDLLILGFRCIIVDIDAVWLEDPLVAVIDAVRRYDAQMVLGQQASSKSFDIGITDDNGEVCGCFVVLNNTVNTLSFWSQVVFEHTSIIKNGLEQGMLDKFSDSEQKILTRLIYERQYFASSSTLGSGSSKLDVILLPKMKFPSGFEYFNNRRNSGIGDDSLKKNTTAYSGNTSSVNSVNHSTSGPAVIHNNFLIGGDMKRIRFLRYGLWHSDNSSHLYRKPHSGSKRLLNLKSHMDASGCNFDNKHIWNVYFTNLSCDMSSIASVTVVLPVHDSVVNYTSDDDRIMIQVTTEGIPVHATSGNITASTYNENKKSGTGSRLWVDNDPPGTVEYDRMVVLEVTVTQPNTVIPLTSRIDDSNIAVSVDISSSHSRPYYAIDKGIVPPQSSWVNVTDIAGDRLHSEANKNVWKIFYSRSNSSSSLSNNSDYVDKPAMLQYRDCHPDPDREKSRMETNKVNFEFVINVLTFNRPASLDRLLASLLAANYSSTSSPIQLVISVDYPVNGSSQEEYEKVMHCREIAEKIAWPFGNKTLVFHTENQGLSQHWYRIWAPVHELQVAYIFEDDTEVSRYYFQWGYSALHHYYAWDDTSVKHFNQIFYHRRLLEAMRRHIRNDGDPIRTSSNKSGTETHMDVFVRETNGLPLIYGICLQKQHLDPMHFPRDLEVRNGFKPFLFSLLGSWGPLFLPIPWVAFREYWSWRSRYVTKHNLLEPLTESVVVNHFYKSNPKIWTPWHVNFAYKTGFKCLYSNFPHNYALVTNHREVGLNYHANMGSSSVLITQSHLIPENGLLQYSMGMFPSWRLLARHQLDFNSRQAGSLGINRVTSTPPLINKRSFAELSWPSYADLAELSNPIVEVHSAMDFSYVYNRYSGIYSSLLTLLPVPRQSDAVFREYGLSDLEYHWINIVDMVLNNVPSHFNIAYFLSVGTRIAVTPLFPLLLPHYWSHELILLPGMVEMNISPCAQLIESLGVESSEMAYLKSLSASDRVHCSSSSRSSGQWLHFANVLQNAVHAESTAAREPNSRGNEMAVLDMNDITLRQMMSAPSPDSDSNGKWGGGSSCNISVPSYVLVLGDCIASPTDFSLSSDFLYMLLAKNSRSSGIKSNNIDSCSEHMSFKYSAVEDMCKEGKSRKNRKAYELLYATERDDEGAVLYRLESELISEYNINWFHSRGVDVTEGSKSSVDAPRRYSLTKRLQHNLITQRFVYRLNQ